MTGQPLTSYAIWCASTGTILSAESCRLVDDTLIDYDELEESSDQEIAQRAKECGTPLLPLVEELHKLRQACAACSALLNAEQWSSDHITAVADVLRSAGYKLEEPN